MTTDQTFRLVVWVVDAPYSDAQMVADILEFDLPETAFKCGKPNLGLSSVGNDYLSGFCNEYARENFSMTLQRGPFEVTPHGA